MRKKKIGLSPRWRIILLNRCAYLGKTALLFLLSFLLVIGPVAPVLAEAATAQQAGPVGLFATVSSVFESACIFARGDQSPSRSIPEKDLAEALAKLEDFSLLVLKNPELIEVIDTIILELIEDEGLPDKIQDNKVFIAEIIRDPRLSEVLGGIISDYLQDERLAGDFEDLFSILFDLITDEELHYFFRDSLAALLENEALEQTMSGLLATAINLIYHSGSDSIADLLHDERIPRVIKELALIATGTVPEMLSALLVDDNNSERALALAEEVLDILAEYGRELPANLLEDKRLREAVADIVLLTVDPLVYDTAGQIALGVTEPLLLKTAEGLTADDTMEDLLGNLAHDFFKGGAQGYFQDSLTKVIKKARDRVDDETPKDRSVVGNEAYIQRQIADAVSMIPLQIGKLGVFTWLVEGNPSPQPPYSQTPDLEVHPTSYKQWGNRLGGLLKQDDRATKLAESLSSDLEIIIDNHLMDEETQGDISDALRKVIEGLPLDAAADEIRENERVDELLEELVEGIIASVPLKDLTGCIFDRKKNGGADLPGVIEEVTGELVDDLPFDRAARLVAEDRRIPETLEAAIPRMPLAEIANTIRHDDRLLDSLSDAASSLPLEAVIDFIQDDARAGLIGRTAADLLLNLVADFIEDERLATFFQGVLLDALSSLDGSPGALILDSLARFFENEDFAGYLVSSLYELVYGVNTELYHLYKQVVPRFFTYALWKFL